MNAAHRGLPTQQLSLDLLLKVVLQPICSADIGRAAYERDM